MTEINDGGPAFPMPSGDEPRENQTTHYNEGMSLRDYFAAKAMQAHIAGLGVRRRNIFRRVWFVLTGHGNIVNEMPAPWSVAKCAYEDADAMLAERAKGKP